LSYLSDLDAPELKLRVEMNIAPPVGIGNGGHGESYLNEPPEIEPLNEDLTLQILQEELNVEKRLSVTGVVRLEKTVRTFDALVDENLTSDSVSIERIPMNRYLDEAVATRQEGDTTVIPVMEERVIVTKQLFLKEEVRITRQCQQERHQERVPLRTEEVEVTRPDPREPPAK